MTDNGQADATVPPGDPRVDDPRVDAALLALDDLESVDLSAQLEVFTDLQAVLAEILDNPEGPAASDGPVPAASDGPVPAASDGEVPAASDGEVPAASDGPLHSPVT